MVVLFQEAEVATLQAAEGPEVHGTDDLPFTGQLGSWCPAAAMPLLLLPVPPPPSCPISSPAQALHAEGAAWRARGQARPLGARLSSGLLLLGTIQTIAPGSQEQTQGCHTGSSVCVCVGGKGRRGRGRCTPQALRLLPCELQMRQWLSSEA